jgi:hypothetical protein
MERQVRRWPVNAVPKGILLRFNQLIEKKAEGPIGSEGLTMGNFQIRMISGRVRAKLKFTEGCRRHFHSIRFSNSLLPGLPCCSLSVSATTPLFSPTLYIASYRNLPNSNQCSNIWTPSMYRCFDPVYNRFFTLRFSKG